MTARWTAVLRRLWAAQARHAARTARRSPPASGAGAAGALAGDLRAGQRPDGWRLDGPVDAAQHSGDGESVRGALLRAAPTPQHRRRLIQAAAAGASDCTLTQFAAYVAALDERQLVRALDPWAQPRGQLRQQSPTTCGSAALVVARMLVDPVYALRVLDGHDAATGRRVVGDVRSRFAAQEQAVKRRTNGVRGRRGAAVPWPRALGTPPWGACREMTGRAGRPGVGYRVLSIDSDSVAARTDAHRQVAAAAAAGAVPLYVGDDALPRHVVLVVGSSDAGEPDGGRLRVYDPAPGTLGYLAASTFRHGRLEMSGWDRPWAAIVPQ